MAEEQKSSRKNNGWKLLIPVVIFVIPGLLFYLSTQKDPANDLVYKYMAIPYPADSIQNRVPEIQKELIEAYGKKDYGTIIKKVTTAQDEGKSVEFGEQFLLGMAYLFSASPEPGLSAKAFNEVANGDNSLIQQASWYQALAYFCNGEPDNCKNILQAIMDKPSHWNKNHAGDLLEAMSK